MQTRTTLSLTGVAVAAITLASLRGPPAVGPGADARSAEPAPAAQRTASPTHDSAASGRGLELLHEFFGVHYGGESSAPGPYQIEVLVASLPDPTDSHLDWAYDTQLEAIRRAFESAGFVVDRFWIPDPKDSLDAQVDGKTRRIARRDREPGVMLFRHRDPDVHRLKMLYLVPEIPTGGIHRDALRTALVERRAILAHLHLPIVPLSRNRIRLIGPTFSGSALSLQLLLRGVMQPAETADVVTGTATSLENVHTLDCPALRIRFRATVNPDESLTEALETLVLRRLGIPARRVAVLRESSTQYGQSVLGRDTTATATTCPHALPQRAAAPSDSFLSIAFPMSISSLRTEYARAPAEGGTSPGFSSSQPKLPLDLVDPSRPKEDLPARSRLSPPTLDLLFDELARVLQRRNIRLVGLLATDVRDKLFLADELRRRVRDLQFFTYESNELYLRADRRPALAGMLVLSTYPLAYGAQPRSEGRRSRRQWFAFANEGAEGVFNATRLQLDSTAQLLDYDADVNGKSTGRPPVWLTTVGNGAFLPLAAAGATSWAPYYVYQSPPGPDARKQAGPSGRGGSTLRYAPFSHLAAVLLSSFAVVLLAVTSIMGDIRTWEALARHPAPVPASERSELRQQIREGSLQLHERLYSLLRLLAVAGIWLAASGLLMFQAWRNGVHWLPALALIPAGLGAVAILTAAASASWIGFRYRRAGSAYTRQLSWVRPAETLDDSGWLWVAELVGRGAVMAFGIWFFALSLGFTLDLGTGLERPDLFYLRGSQIGSMVSPLLPLLASGAGFTAWCSWHLTRIRLLQRDTAYGSAAAAQPIPQDPAATMVADLIARFHRAAVACRRGWNGLYLVFPRLSAFALLAFVAIVCVWLWPEFGATLESISFARTGGGLTPFDWLLRLSIYASFLSTLWAVFRLYAVWRALRTCLDELSALPLLGAFSRLPPELSRLARLSLPGRSVVTGVGAISIRQWRQLHAIHDQAGDAFAREPGGSAELQQAVDQLMTGPEVFRRDPRSGRVPAELGVKIRDLQVVLSELWSRQLPDPPAGAPAAPAAAGVVGFWRQKAEEYLATQVAGYAEWVVGHLRVLALFLLLSLLLTTVLLYSYPFQPQGLVRLLFTLILLITIGVIVYVSTQMNRNPLLSQIAGTAPGAVTWDAGFVGNLVTFGLVPLLTLLGSAFPGFRNFLFSWAEPLVRALVKQ
jgi:hypothetical protein